MVEQTAPPQVNRFRRGLRRALARLSWTGANGTAPPEEGTPVLIWKGDTRSGIGRMGIVTKKMNTMAEVTYLNQSARLQTRKKFASSLINLQEGLRVEQGPEGMLWIVHEDMVDVDDETGPYVSDADDVD